MTEWRWVKGYEGHYQVSDDGSVRSVDRYTTGKDGRTILYKGRELKSSLGKNGYFIVSLWKNGKQRMAYVHRLVAEAFIDNPSGKKTVNHIDGARTNNSVANLEWATHGENNLHEYRVLGKRGAGRKLDDEQAREVISSSESNASLSRKFGVSGSVITNIRKGRIYKDAIRSV